MVLVVASQQDAIAASSVLSTTSNELAVASQQEATLALPASQQLATRSSISLRREVVSSQQLAIDASSMLSTTSNELEVAAQHEATFALFASQQEFINASS